MEKYDLIVVGGGLSGVAAAVSAAREGVKVLLIEKCGCLGGAMSNSAVYPFMKYYIKKEDGTRRLLSDGIFTEMRRRHEEMGGVEEYGLSPEIFKIMLDEMATEAGVEILFHTMLIGAETDGRKIKKIRVAERGGAAEELEADYFIDASGDGELMAMSGCAFQLGRESDGLSQPMTTCFRLSGVDLELFAKEKEALQEKYKAEKEKGNIRNPRENILTFTGLGDGILHLNTTRVIKLSPLDSRALSVAEIEARRQVLEMYNFLRKNSESCKNSRLISIAQEIGIRESRKLLGVHLLTADEMKAQTAFEDTVALGNYMIDIHNPSGEGTYRYRFNDGEYYRIPYRSLLPKEVDNLLVAGRCLSATHEAHSAVRIMPICACLGEAAGAAAAIAKSHRTDFHKIDTAELRTMLVRKGAAVD
ncbi:MAG: FAD-dependent oxidoreductase [Ruminococcaceae bacterium]|nr:FAD-dependent oxidoreductase [Oscillospiraceae bacterium]